MSAAILQVQGLIKQFGALRATDDLHLRVEEGELHAIIGPNGAGKTTLLSQLSGQIKPSAGHILYRGDRINDLGVVARVRLGLVRSFQITSLWPALTVLENVMLAVQAQQGHSFHFFRNAMKVASVIEPAEQCLELVGLAHRSRVKVYELSHGEQRQLEIGVALATRPKMLLLDEPLAGMGSDDSQRVVRLLHRLKQHYTIVLVEHDMDAVFSLADRISVLVYGHCAATGTPGQIRDDEQVRAAYLGDEAPC